MRNDDRNELVRRLQEAMGYVASAHTCKTCRHYDPGGPTGARGLCALTPVAQFRVEDFAGCSCWSAQAPPAKPDEPAGAAPADTPYGLADVLSALEYRVAELERQYHDDVGELAAKVNDVWRWKGRCQTAATAATATAPLRPQDEPENPAQSRQWELTEEALLRALRASAYVVPNTHIESADYNPETGVFTLRFAK